MNREDIIRMAREAFAVEFVVDEDVPRLERFAALVAAAEREACAQLCYSRGPFDGTVSVEVKLARAIRARGEK